MAREQHSSVKRKRGDELMEDPSQDILSSEILAAVEQLNIMETDRSLTEPVNTLLKLAKDEVNADLIIKHGAVTALVRCLQEHKVEEESALTLGLLAKKREHQRLIEAGGALPHLVALIKRHTHGQVTPEMNGVTRRAAYAITRLSHGNVNIQNSVRDQGGIPPLVEILELKSIDVKVMRDAARALRALALENDENKTKILDCNALLPLVQMLRSENVDIHYQAVGLIGALTQSSPKLLEKVLLDGALQPIIILLSSTCSRTQIEAASLLCQLIAVDTKHKAHIVQRGALGPLVVMLQSRDDKLEEISSFVLGRLARECAHNQAGIAKADAIEPLLKLLDSTNGAVQRNSAIALYELAYSEDIVHDLIRFGIVQKLIEGNFDDLTQVYVRKTFIRLEERIGLEMVFDRLLSSLMCTSDKNSQREYLLALAMFCSSEDQNRVFVENNGIDLLVELLGSTDSKIRRYGYAALYELAEKTTSLSPVDAGQTSPISHVYCGEQYVNNSDVTFLVEGKLVYAQKTCLLASSDAFRAMLDGGFKEKDAKCIEIPNIRCEVFVLLMRYIHTGSIQVLNPRIVPDLLRAADEYLIDGLKRICENAMVEHINADNIAPMYRLSEESYAVSLRNACILFIVKNSEKLDTKPWFRTLVMEILPEIKDYVVKRLAQTLPQ